VSERVVQCPHCGAPATPPSKWARSAVCGHCGVTVLLDPDVVATAHYRQAGQAWEAKAAPSIGDAHYWFGGRIASGSRSDVYLAQRARFPTERVVVKALREGGDQAAFEEEWSLLDAIAKDSSFELGDRVPIPLGRGALRGGPLDGRHAIVFRWAPGFVRTVEEARAASANGIEPVIVAWVWRRTLEVLAAVHRLGFVHRDLSPAHLIFQENEHGIRVVGWGAAKRADEASRALDVSMSARAILAVVAQPIPAPFGPLLREVAGGGATDAWTLREKLGTVAREAFGAPGFHPLRI
jgi:serine/threonine protein kinase